MKKKLSHLLLVALGVCMMIACKQSPEFEVKGVVAEADGQTMYLENVGLSSVVLMDSIKLNASGKFAFKKPSPEYPDFYRLRLNQQHINFAIDSTETISIVADAGTFATSYTMEGSENGLAIKEITLAQLDANQALTRLRKDFDGGIISDSSYQRCALDAIEEYKTVAKKYIYTKPGSTASYFALFQQVSGMLFFDLYDKSDSRAYGAVATSYNHFYPESPRAKHLYNLAIQSLKALRSERGIDWDNIATKEVDYLDIELPDVMGNKIKLSEVSKDKVVILNFTAYQMEWSLELNQILNTAYTKYHEKGLEVYQISLDSDLHLWKNVASNMPWDCVRDPQSVYSQLAATYNIRQLPVIFLIDRKGSLVKRVEDMNTFETDLQALL
ncbi:MAG: AhpC/TSA family protein [Tannerella sp.]|jgi:peroxiredoxin|nr:AhpC/TSA family protein [Tannerella sp.]